MSLRVSANNQGPKRLPGRGHSSHVFKKVEADQIALYKNWYTCIYDVIDQLIQLQIEN